MSGEGVAIQGGGVKRVAGSRNDNAGAVSRTGMTVKSVRTYQ
jgi:hypothetical protein